MRLPATPAVLALAMPLPESATLLECLQSTGAELLFLLEYGSGKNDLDLLAVYQRPPQRNEIIVGRLDLLAIGRDALAHMIRHMEPSVTEPLLTGRLVDGNEGAWRWAQESVRSTVIDWQVIRHLVRGGHVAYGNALACLPSTPADAFDAFARPFWDNLSWALSYHEFARYYSERIDDKDAAIRLSCLVKHMRQPVQSLWRDILSAKQNNSLNHAEAALKRFERLCLLKTT